MKKLKRFSGIGMALTAAIVVVAQEPEEVVDIPELKQVVVDVCPVVWEDITTVIDTSNLSQDVWNGIAADRNAFKTFVQSVMGTDAPDASGLEAMAADTATVASECATHRIALLDGLIARTPVDVLHAMNAFTERAEQSVARLGGGWEVGDIRITGRAQASDGWVFLHGQTVGNDGSGADLEGIDYFELFNLARQWHPNSGTEDWEAGNTVSLPDTRGRALIGSVNMGGAASSTLTDPQAAKIGGQLGAEKHVLTQDEMPQHSHTVAAAGNHRHTTWGTATVETGVGKGGGATALKKIRHTASSTNGNHGHTAGDTGGGTAHPIVQPSIVFNVEMKY